MAQFFIPKSGTVTVGKIPYRLFRGVHEISDALANSHEANAFGIKPVNEMTDDEWRMSGLVRDHWMATHAAEAAPAKVASTDAPGGQAASQRASASK